MPDIFISSRRGDASTTIIANNIFERLRRTYRSDTVSNELGCPPSAPDLRRCVAEKIARYSLVLAVVGPNWLGAHRAIDAQNDLVRLELEEAHGAGIPIVPILVRGAAVPPEEDLPPTTQFLAARATVGTNAMRFTTGEQFTREMRQLYRLIGQVLEARATGADVHIPPNLVTEAPDYRRKADLNAAIERNKQLNYNPCFGLQIRTRGELDFLIEKLRLSGHLDPNAAPPPDLRGADLSYANLSGAQLVNADLRSTRLHRTNLGGAALAGANLAGAKLEFTILKGADLQNAVLSKAEFLQTDVSESRLGGADLTDANLHGMDLTPMQDLQGACLRGADLGEAIARKKMALRGIDFTGAHLENAEFPGADLTDANLTGVLCVGLNLAGAQLNSARIASYDFLKQVTIDKKTDLASAAWEGVKPRTIEAGSDRLSAYRDAVRVNHQVSHALKEQGLLSLASEYRLREQRMQRNVLRAERRYGAWLFSGLLNAVAGYGERLGRTVAVYLGIVLGFAAAIYLMTNEALIQSAPLTWYQSLIFSITSFHGRSIIQSGVALGDPLAGVAAIEGLCGLFIELIFIAAFSRRFLGD